MALNVTGKTAIVTGAGSGINLCFAKLLLEQGCNTVFADLSLRPEAEAVLNSYNDGGHSESRRPRAIFQPTDVTSWTQLETLFSITQQTFGRVDIVCPGAGVYDPPLSNFWIPPGTGASMDDAQLGRYASIDINLIHPVRCTQMAISHFIKHKQPGVIVHISSIAAQSPHLQCPLYCASKAAISAFVRSLARLETPPTPDLPPIRVNAVAPGVIKTPLWTDNPDKLKWIDEERDEWVSPEEVASVMLDLIQKDECVGGTVLEVGKNQVRRVQLLNDPGPSGAGHSTSAGRKGVADVWDRLVAQKM